MSIQTGARLHFGPLSYAPAAGRHFGGLGLMIDAPNVRLSICTGKGEASTTHVGRGSHFLRKIASSLDYHEELSLHVQEEIPSHQGLGSGTQLGLAVAEAVSELTGGDQRTAVELARLCGRGERSAIGIYGYEQGGFLIDAGQRQRSLDQMNSGRTVGESASSVDAIGQLAAREEFPHAWRVLLVHPAHAVGLHGTDERALFRTLPSMSEALSGRLCRIALTEILPAVRHADFAAWSAAIYEYGVLAGEFFAPAQGGIFAAPGATEFVQSMRSLVSGIVQSSWGPTLALFCEHVEHANEVVNACRRYHWSQRCQLQLTRARNVGRQLEFHAD